MEIPYTKSFQSFKGENDSILAFVMILYHHSLYLILVACLSLSSSYLFSQGDYMSKEKD